MLSKFLTFVFWGFCAFWMLVLAIFDLKHEYVGAYLFSVAGLAFIVWHLVDSFLMLWNALKTEKKPNQENNEPQA